MQRVATWLIGLGLAAGCAPDYAHTAFRCDATSGCPDGQTCTGGRCKLGGAIGDGVRCDTVTCSPTEQCCVDVINPARCIAGGDTCPGRAAMCDGVEDCPAGAVCCGDDPDLVTCRTGCSETVCRDDADCPSTLPRCCFFNAFVPWGSCAFTC